jgi:hypothetical protein
VGTSVILDIIFSAVIAGAVLLMIISMNQTVSSSTFVSTNELSIQTNMTTLVRIVETDFRKIGYCKDPLKILDPSKSIKTVGRTMIKFISDVQNDGTVDTVEYTLGDTTSCRVTPNPRDRMLYRTISSSATGKKTQGYSLGVLRFDFIYYDALADSILLAKAVADPSSIYSLQLSVLLESPYAYDTTYSYSYWRQIRLAARNLRAR